MSDVQPSSTGKFLGIGAAVVAIGAVALLTTRSSTPTVEAPLITPPTNEPAPASNAATLYKNGTYTQDGLYTTPAGDEKVTIQLTIQDDVITSSAFTGYATHPASVRWQGAFSQGMPDQVVGKRVDDVSLTVVSGSSLTPKGFMDALAKIQAEAQS